MAGGIFGLLGVVSEYRGALEYDFWFRFGTGLEVIGTGMSLTTAARLTKIIRSDPSSALAAAVEGWDHPVSREAAVLMDLWDLEAAKSGAKSPPRYPRVWAARGEQERMGDVGGRSPDEVRDILRKARGGAPV